MEIHVTLSIVVNATIAPNVVTILANVVVNAIIIHVIACNCIILIIHNNNVIPLFVLLAILHHVFVDANNAEKYHADAGNAMFVNHVLANATQVIVAVKVHANMDVNVT